MRIISLFVVFFGASFAALANGGSRLALSPAELDRLGVEFHSAQAVAQAGIASGPAEVVIPPAKQAIVSTTVSGVLSRLFVAEGEGHGWHADWVGESGVTLEGEREAFVGWFDTHLQE